LLYTSPGEATRHFFDKYIDRDKPPALKLLWLAPHPPRSSGGLDATHRDSLTSLTQLEIPMTTENITLTPINAATANAAAQVILNRLDIQIRNLEQAWSGGYYDLKFTVSDIKKTTAAAFQNIDFLWFLGVITLENKSQLRTQVYGANRGAIDRRDTRLANKAHDKIRNDLAKSYKNSDC
jgi:hypothetical protein